MVFHNQRFDAAVLLQHIGHESDDARTEPVAARLGDSANVHFCSADHHHCAADVDETPPGEDVFKLVRRQRRGATAQRPEQICAE